VEESPFCCHFISFMRLLEGFRVPLQYLYHCTFSTNSITLQCSLHDQFKLIASGKEQKCESEERGAARVRYDKCLM
jgi:hypothetical protein